MKGETSKEQNDGKRKEKRERTKRIIGKCDHRAPTPGACMKNVNLHCRAVTADSPDDGRENFSANVSNCTQPCADVANVIAVKHAFKSL